MNPASIPGKLPKTYEPFYYLKIGKELTDWEGLIDLNTTPTMAVNKLQSFPTRVGEMNPSKSADPDINFSMFGRAFIRESARHCNFAGTDCWTVRVHPRIDKISASSGYVDGGQTLQISGSGLGGKDISVKVDGVACIVDPAASSATTITCETQPKGNASLVNFKQPGAYGATHRFYNPADETVSPGWSAVTDGKYPPTVSLATTLEL